MKLSLWHVTAALVALASAAPEKRGAFDYAAHLGNLSPYQSAPVPSGMEAALPDDCTVDQVMLVSSPLCRWRDGGARVMECERGSWVL